MTRSRQVLSMGIATTLIIVFLGLHFTNSSAVIPAKVTPPIVYQVVDLVNMTEEEFWQIKENEIIKVITDTANAHNINPYVLCGLGFYESERFRYAHKKIKDCNGRWSYGVYMIQLETAIEYDKDVTEEKLLKLKIDRDVAIDKAQSRYRLRECELHQELAARLTEENDKLVSIIKIETDLYDNKVAEILSEKEGWKVNEPPEDTIGTD